ALLIKKARRSLIVQRGLNRTSKSSVNLPARLRQQRQDLKLPENQVYEVRAPETFISFLAFIYDAVDEGKPPPW
ncbi:hypothetical protein NECAME_17375, partial [Necator americanus]